MLQLPAADPPEKPGAAHGRGLLSPRGCHMAPPAAPPPPPSRRHRGGSERGGRAGELASETALTKKIPPARLPKESFLKSTYLYFLYVWFVNVAQRGLSSVRGDPSVTCHCPLQIKGTRANAEQDTREMRQWHWRAGLEFKEKVRITTEKSNVASFFSFFGQDMPGAPQKQTPRRAQQGLVCRTTDFKMCDSNHTPGLCTR